MNSPNVKSRYLVFKALVRMNVRTPEQLQVSWRIMKEGARMERESEYKAKREEIRMNRVEDKLQTIIDKQNERKPS